jgi:integrase
MGVMGGKKGKLTSKRAILDPKIEEQILEAADPITERPAIFLMMKFGMHPKNVANLSLSNLLKDEQGYWLQYKRVKNENPRRELLSTDVGELLEKFLSRKTRPATHQAYWEMVRRVGKKAGCGSISPMTLRHTACINFLRQYRDHHERMDLVARRMGCTRAVVLQHYLDLDTWERMK